MRTRLPTLCLAAVLLAAITHAANLTNLSQYEETYNFAVQINVSGSHPPTYLTPFNRPGNFTINVSTRTGVIPTLPKPQDFKRDTKITLSPRFDPRTCQHDVAVCYNVIVHEQNRTTFGRNYTGVSSYVLPARRVRQYLCIGNDTGCIRGATHCFCPTEKVPAPPPVYESAECAAPLHVCQDSYATFRRCTGNLTECAQQSITCACGLAPVCAGQLNACIDERDQLILCKGAMNDCLKNYERCFCGPDMLYLQKGCTTLRHACTLGSIKITCTGSFASCALAFDTCDC
jgi:hypothetical protein